ncbi:MAG TPA: S9 family peptidase [Bryobacteraceae bacterium]|nr:S9 family peptidase [Bryobacteraceae bacterium]
MTRPLLLFLLASCLLSSQSSVTPPPNLHAEGVPPIPAGLMEELGHYSDIRAASLLDWHPANREILIATRFGDVPQIHHVAMPGGARTQLTFLPDRTGAARYRPGKGDMFVFSKDTGGGEFYQLYRFDMESGRITLLTDGHSRNTGELWSGDGRWLAYSSTLRNGRDTDIYVMNPDDPKSARMVLEVEGGGWFASSWSPDGQKLIVEDRRSVHDSSLYLVDVQTGSRQSLTPEEASYGSARFARSGKGIYLITDRGSEFERPAYLDFTTRELTFLRPSQKWDAGDLELSDDGRRLAYSLNEDGFSGLHVMDTQTRQDISLPAIPRGVISGVRWSRNGRDLGFNLSSARSPSDVYSIDVEKGALERWTASETGGLNAQDFSEPELIHWKSFDGRNVSGFLYLPPPRFAGPRPVIVNIHGGPEGQSRPAFIGRNNYFITELGAAMIYPNVRGSTGYGKTYLALDNGMKREDSVKDIGALLDWIAADPRLDSQRVMVTGVSYGGYMTLASAFHFNDRLRCAVDVVGVSNFVSFFERTSPYRRDLRRVEYGDERDPKIRAFFEKIAPLHHAAEISKPMFIVAGRNDPRVPAHEGEQMAAAIRKNGAPVWYLVADDEGHGFAKKKNQDFQFAATVMFVKQFLLQ